MGNETMDCPVCDAPGCVVKPGARGGYSTNCPTCGYQGFARTPKAADAMRAKLTKKPGRTPTEKPAGDDGDFLRKL